MSISYCTAVHKCACGCGNKGHHYLSSTAMVRVIVSATTGAASSHLNPLPLNRVKRTSPPSQFTKDAVVDGY
ncbi:hypothetical protein MHAE_04440 [Mycobacterium haemophilum DSM 44634]|uniref:Uncharacterized protein n=1 Tax=Mycobacterium haemophilum TaxID=29311 RepID=A0A0I9Y6L8_9MYCO|nr:hypothetical protein ABH38_16520 [Mycobacterium haemophilum]